MWRWNASRRPVGDHLPPCSARPDEVGRVVARDATSRTASRGACPPESLSKTIERPSRDQDGYHSFHGVVVTRVTVPVASSTRKRSETPLSYASTSASLPNGWRSAAQLFDVGPRT